MAGKQEYNQVCPVASALDVVGSRWALLVVRELSLGPRRFGDISAGLESASTDMLTSRLRELEAVGVIERTEGRRYQLTAQGLALSPVLRSMMVWSMRTGSIDGVGADGSPRSFGPDPVRRVMGLLSLIARTTPLATKPGTVAVTCDDLVVQAVPWTIGYRITEVDPADTVDLDGTITMSSDALLGLVIGAKPADELVAAGEISADTSAAKRVLRDLSSAIDAVQAEIGEPVG